MSCMIGGAVAIAAASVTGTPLIANQKTTGEFGTYIDTYTIEQAVADGATTQILYEGREAETKVTGDSLDALFDRYFQDKTPEEKEAIKKKYVLQAMGDGGVASWFLGMAIRQSEQGARLLPQRREQTQGAATRKQTQGAVTKLTLIICY